MLKEIGNFLEKLTFRIVDYILRKTTLNFILYSLIMISLGEAAAWVNNKGLTELIVELKVKFPDGIFYYIKIL